MVYLKWGFRTVIIIIIASFLHYTLPGRDVVYISGVDIKREDSGNTAWFWGGADSGADTGTAAQINRDVRFIDTVQHENGRVMVYRNEDTGLGWPPYFKFNSADVQAQARTYIGPKDAPQWVLVKHYGWRMVWFSMYPNVISIQPIDDPNARFIPWFNLIFLTFLFAAFWAIRVRVRRFYRSVLAPLFDRISDKYHRVRVYFKTWGRSP